MERRRDKISRAHEDAFRSGLRVQVQAAIRAYRNGDSVDLAIREAQGPILKAMSALYYEAFMSFARSTHDEILKRAQKNVDEATLLTWEQLATRFVKEIGTRKITRINETSRGLIAAVIERTIAAGGTVPDAAREIRLFMGEDLMLPQDWRWLDKAIEKQGLTGKEAEAYRQKRIGKTIKNRAERITRTETIGASNYGAIEGARATGLPIEKRWLATPGPRTRPTHTAADGQTRPLDGRFDVGSASLDHPGDQTVNAPDETINCRCAVTFEVVEVGAPSAPSAPSAPVVAPTPKPRTGTERLQALVASGKVGRITDDVYTLSVKTQAQIAEALEESTAMGTRFFGVTMAHKRGRSLGIYTRKMDAPAEPGVIQLRKTAFRKADWNVSQTTAENFQAAKTRNLARLERRLQIPGLPEDVATRTREEIARIQGTVRWGSYQEGRAHYAIVRHETWHGTYYQTPGLEEAWERNTAHIGGAERAKVSEYGASSSVEFFPEVATAIDMGIDIPAVIRAAFEKTLKEVGL